MFVCDDCGTASDDSLGFCRKCGSTRGHHVDDQVGEDRLRIDTSQGTVFIDPVLANRVPIAMFLAFVPGLFDIFGLGQLYLRKYSHGALFLGLTALVASIRFLGFLPAVMPYMMLISLGVFILQMVDVYIIVGRMIR